MTHNFSIFILSIYAFCMALLIASHAFAAEAAGATTVDIGTALASVIGVIFSVIGGVILWGVSRLLTLFTKKTSIEIDAKVREVLLGAVDNAITWGKQEAIGKAGSIGSVDVKSETVAGAINYLIERVPDSIAHFGLDEDALEKLVMARLDFWFGSDSTAPAASTESAPT